MRTIRSTNAVPQDLGARLARLRMRRAAIDELIASLEKYAAANAYSGCLPLVFTRKPAPRENLPGPWNKKRASF